MNNYDERTYPIWDIYPEGVFEEDEYLWQIYIQETWDGPRTYFDGADSLEDAGEMRATERVDAAAKGYFIIFSILGPDGDEY